ncbi:hypothetical protein [Brotaphodocola sp.]|uniref:hypothetical protein n=1 Tax=Brotaphodocola sp. TaxID=3073577 RepID=UPI003D7CF71A
MTKYRCACVWRTRFRRILSLLISTILIVLSAGESWAMEAPGDGSSDWIYKNYHWYYRDSDGSNHTGWLKYGGEWYWFSENGEMADGGSLAINGVTYYFFINGHMARNQYLGLEFFGDDGQHQSDGDIRTIGNADVTTEQKDLITDALYLVPRGWLERFVRDGWQIMFYTKKKYFSAPSTDLGIYYVYHSMDSEYEKVKTTKPEFLLEAMCEYVGYASGCYKKGDARMETLWNAYPVLQGILEIPDYYASDSKFYFGKLVSAYLEGEKTEEIQRIAPEVCEVIEEILHENDSEEEKEYYRQQAELARQEAEAYQERVRAEGGPGVNQEAGETKEESN